jgi:hypothetical protein
MRRTATVRLSAGSVAQLNEPTTSAAPNASSHAATPVPPGTELAPTVLAFVVVTFAALLGSAAVVLAAQSTAASALRVDCAPRVASNACAGVTSVRGGGGVGVCVCVCVSVCVCVCVCVCAWWVWG